MTDILELTKQVQSDESDKSQEIIMLYPNELEKLEALLREKFIAELGEPVAEALHERNRLGYAVVDVIGTLDEIIENAQEVEVDDFLHIAIPIDKWHELQDALEEMPKRAELYTMIDKV